MKGVHLHGVDYVKFNEKMKGVSEVCEDFLGFKRLKVANAKNITENAW